MATKSSFILMIASLINLVYAINYSPKLYGDWFHIVHKGQISLILVAWLVYLPNRINRYAIIGYLSIVLLNWVLFIDVLVPSAIANTISIITSVLYCLSLLIVLIIEKWFYSK